MTSVTEVQKRLQYLLEERAKVVARETGCIVRERKFDGADLLQTLVFSFVHHPHASLEQMASMANLRKVQVSDTAVHKRFNEACARFLHSMLQEMTEVVVQSEHRVPLRLLRRFSAVICEDSSQIALPCSLADQWRGCGGSEGVSAGLKVHTRWELIRGRLWGPSLTDARTSDRRSPFLKDPVPVGGLYVADLGYFCQARIVERFAAGGLTLTRLQAGTLLKHRDRQPLLLWAQLPKTVGQVKELEVLVGARAEHPMRLLLIRVPKEVGEKRRADLLEGAQRRGQQVSEETLRLADWTILVTDVPARLLNVQEALVLLRERWQLELLFKGWKQQAQVDEWHTAKSWRVLCELYAKLIGVLLQHWMIVLFAWQDPQRSLVKVSQVMRDCGWGIMQALAGLCSWRGVLKSIQLRMQAGCQMNKRKKHPNSAQLLQAQAVEWVLCWCE